MRKQILACVFVALFAIMANSNATYAAVNTAYGGMLQWTSGQVTLSSTNVWYDVPNLNTTITVKKQSLWRVSANVRYRYIPINSGDYCSTRFQILVDGKVQNLVGVVFDPSGSGSMDEFNNHANVDALVVLPAGKHTVKVQALKWGAASNSHIDIFADMNGYSNLIWHKVSDL